MLPIPAEAVKHRAANPDLWRAWRRTPQGVELKSDQKEWNLLEYDDEYAALPRGTTVNGTFSNENNTYETRKYRFSADGSFKYCKYVGLAMSGERASGTYTIDAYVIRLRYTDGTAAAYSFVYDPKQRPNTLWLDQEPHKRVNTENAASPLACD